MSKAITTRRWFRFSLRKLLIAVCVVALSFVVVPTAIHWWTWPQYESLHRKVLHDKLQRLEVHVKNYGYSDVREYYYPDPCEDCELPEGMVLSCPCGELCPLRMVVGPIDNGEGNYLPAGDKFLLGIQTPNGIVAGIYSCCDIDEAMNRVRQHHWNHHVNWGPRLAKSVQEWWTQDDVPVEEENPFADIEFGDPFAF